MTDVVPRAFPAVPSGHVRGPSQSSLHHRPAAGRGGGPAGGPAAEAARPRVVAGRRVGVPGRTRGRWGPRARVGGAGARAARVVRRVAAGRQALVARSRRRRLARTVRGDRPAAGRHPRGREGRPRGDAGGAGTLAGRAATAARRPGVVRQPVRPETVADSPRPPRAVRPVDHPGLRAAAVRHGVLRVRGRRHATRHARRRDVGSRVGDRCRCRRAIRHAARLRWRRRRCEPRRTSRPRGSLANAMEWVRGVPRQVSRRGSSKTRPGAGWCSRETRSTRPGDPGTQASGPTRFVFEGERWKSSKYGADWLAPHRR